MQYIYHQDCVEGVNALTEKATLVIADPPYGKKICSWDVLTTEFIEKSLAAIVDKLAPDGSLYWFGWPDILAVFYHLFLKRFTECRWLIWHYRTTSNINHNTWGRNFQAILYCHHGNPKFNLDAVRIPYADKTNTKRKKHDDTTSRYGIKKNQATENTKKYHDLGRKPMDVLIGPTVVSGVAEQEGWGHKTQKPIWLIEQLVKASSDENDLVVDLCAGSGTTPLVCRLLNRRCIAFETDKDWVDKARLRLEVGGSSRDLSYSSEMLASEKPE